MNGREQESTSPSERSITTRLEAATRELNELEELVKSGALDSRVLSEFREAVVNDPYRSPAKCNVTSYWYYKTKTKEMTVPSHQGEVIAPADFKQRFSQARQSAVGRGEGFIVGFLEEIICSIRRMEYGRRSAFLGRVERDAEGNARAVRWIRGRGFHATPEFQA